MPKLPNCPHCHTIFRYGDIRKIMNKKKIKCYHCNCDILISRRNFLILFLIIALFCAIFDVLELYMVGTINFAALFFTNVVFIAAGLFLRPFFVKFKKSGKNSGRKK